MTNALESRITRQDTVDPKTLKANQLNWRTHPLAQREAMTEILNEVGWVQNVIVNERSGNIIDGHLRVDIAVEREEPTVPVSYVDLDDEQERLVLATFDSIATMATADPDQLSKLLDGIILPHGALDALLSGIIGDNSPLPAIDNSGANTDEQLEGLEFRVVIDVVSAEQQAELIERFEKEGLICHALIS